MPPESYAFEVQSEPIGVAVSASIVSDHVQQYRREEVVELARLCVNPDHRWATRVVLRLWREVAAPRWKCWPIRAAVAYSQTRRHEGDIYRFDGWTLKADGAGSSGGGSWSRKRYAYRRSPRQKAAMGLGLRKGRPVTWVYIPRCRSFEPNCLRVSRS